jgi:DNA-binding NtrC family response regulator
MTAMRTRVLIVDDEEGIRRLVRVIFTREGVDVTEAPDGRRALARAVEDSPDTVLLDLTLPDGHGLAVLEQLKAAAPDTPVVILTGSRDVKHAVQAMQLGAFDYLTKPIDRAELVAVVRRAIEAKALRTEVRALRRELRAAPPDSLVVQMGPGPEIQRLTEDVRRVAASNFSVLILGETGTGKELVARAIHQASERRRRPFVALDCGAIPELLLESELFGHERGAFTGADRQRAGHFRHAEGGTCFLDEIGNMPIGLQAKLLRTLESKQIQAVGADQLRPMDVRFVASTNEGLQGRVSQGLFRTDLYFRLAQFTIVVPPLRERRADLAYLTQRFIEETAVELRRPVQGIEPDALERLREHDWPGNVRELRNVVRRAVLLAEGFTIGVRDLPAPLPSAGAPETPSGLEASGASLREVAAQAAAGAERQAISQALRAAGGNKSQAARTLRTDYKTLHVKMKALGIHAKDFA